jgi:perosamine synthetase
VGNGVLAMHGGSPAVDRRLLRRGPDVAEDDLTAGREAMARGESSVFGRNVLALQDEFAAHLGRRFCLAVDTGTAACHAAMIGAGIGPGDEVLTSALSFTATPMSILLAEGTPVFADIDPHTFEMDLVDAERLVTPRTRAVFPVHVHGLVSDMGAVTAFARRHDLTVVEDAAQATGGTFDGRLAGSWGRTAAFSLNKAKPWESSEGGLVVCDDEDVFRAVKLLCRLGEEREPLADGQVRNYSSEYVGLNYRMLDNTAAVARSKFTRLPRRLAQARSNMAILGRRLSAITGVTPPLVPPERESTFAYVRVLLDPAVHEWEGPATEFRDRVICALRAEGVPVTVWQLRPLPAMPLLLKPPTVYRPGMVEEPLGEWDPTAYPVTVAVLDSSIILGEQPYMLHDQPSQVVVQIADAFEKVVEHIGDVMVGDYEPLVERPPIRVAHV